MFIQSAPPGRPSRAIFMHEHTALSGQFARAYGNAQFEPATPLDLVAYVIANHDAGWVEFDRDPATDPSTGLPYNVFQTPPVHILPTSKASPDYNERHHPYCGLLSSMHTWGIYTGRYGFTTAGKLRAIAEADKPAVDAMLRFELERQTRLKAQLLRSAEAAGWVEEPKLFQNYKLLQFCDLLAIYFNTLHAGARTEQAFTHVPMSAFRDATVTIKPVGSNSYALSPFPFAAPTSEFAFAGRPISPGQPDPDGGWAQILSAAPTKWELFNLIPA